jgi:hypothetical protein
MGRALCGTPKAVARAEAERVEEVFTVLQFTALAVGAELPAHLHRAACA